MIKALSLLGDKRKFYLFIYLFICDVACLESFVMNWNLMALYIGLEVYSKRQFLLQRDGNLGI